MADIYALEEKIDQAVKDYLKAENLVLVDLKLRHQKTKYVLRIFVDEPTGGITLDRCKYLNKAIGQLLDKDNLIQDKYILEVASPGIDRPLVTKEDFSRCINRKIRIFLNQEQANEISGVVKSVSDTVVGIDSKGQVQQVDLGQIRKAKQII